MIFPPLFMYSSCWINNNIVFYITVVGYFCMIFLLNVSMFIVVLIQLCRIKKKKQLGTQRKTSIQDLRSVAGLTFLLGITWGFAFFAWGPVNLIFMYLFAIFNTLQGKFMLCYGLLYKNVMNNSILRNALLCTSVYQKLYLCCYVIQKIKLPWRWPFLIVVLHLKKINEKQTLSEVTWCLFECIVIKIIVLRSIQRIGEATRQKTYWVI